MYSKKMRRNRNVNFFTVSSLVATALSVFAFSVTTSQVSAASESSRNEERVSSRSRIPKADGAGGKSQTPYSESLGPDIEGMRRKGTYIVTTRTKTGNARVMSGAKQKGIQIGRQFESGVHGFTARLTQQQIRDLRVDPNVASVVADKRARALGSQDSPEWHLDRLDGDREDWTYSFSSTGQGVKIYIVDTGVRTDHTEFTGRIPRGYNAITNQTSGFGDCNGHGTHVAGLAAGMEYGVAKMATVIPVKVLDCSGYGSVSDIISGLNWIKADVSANPGPAVVNMSLGVEADSALDTAVQSLITAGITVVAAAGNERTNACSGDGALSPARVENVLTVGGLDYWSYEDWFTGESSDKDALWYWSNYGTCVDVYGPSYYLLSAWNSGFNAVNEISGTSMASPLAAGVAAMYLENNVSKTPAEVSTAVLGASKTNIIDDRSYPLSNKASFNNRALAVVSPPIDDVGDSRELASPFRSFSFYDDDEDEVQEEFTGRSSLYLTTNNATYDVDDPDVATGVRTIWTRFVAPEDGELEISLYSNTTSVGAGLYQANPGGTLTKVGANPSILPITRTILRGQHYYVLFYSTAATGVYFDAKLSLDVDAPTNITSSAASVVSSSLPQIITGTTSRATRWNYDEEDRNSVWFKFTMPSGSAKNIIIDTSESEFDTTVALTTSNGIILNHNDNHGGVTWSRLSYTVQPNVTYWVVVGSNDRSDYGDFTLNIAEATTPIPVNNSISNASQVTSIPGTFSGSNVNADSEFNEENHLYGYSSRGGGCSKAKPMCALNRIDAEATSGSSVWWKFVAPASGRLTVSTISSNFKTVLAVYRQYRFDEDYFYRQYLDNDYCVDVTECGTSPSTVDFSVRQGATYLIAVAGFAERGFIPSEGTFTLSVSGLASLNSPANDMLANATEINVATSGSIAGTVVDATGEEEYGSDQNVWYTFIAPQTGVVVIDSDEGSMLLTGYVQKNGRLLQRESVYVANRSLRLSVKQGERYYIEAAADLQDSASTFALIIEALVVRSPIVNDTPDLATTINVGTAGSLMTSANPVRSIGPLDSWIYGTRYYTLAPEVSGPITLSAPASFQMGIFTGTEGSFVEVGKTSIRYEDDNYQGSLTVNLNAGTSYTLVLVADENPISLSWTALAAPVAPAPPAAPVPAAQEPASVETPVPTVDPVPTTTTIPASPSLLSSSAGKQVAISRAPSKALATDSAVAVKSNKVTVALMVPQSKNKNSQIVKYTIVLKPAKGKAVTKNVSAKAGKKLSTSLSGAKGVKYKLVITGFTKEGKKVMWNGPSITTPKK